MMSPTTVQAERLAHQSSKANSFGLTSVYLENKPHRSEHTQEHAQVIIKYAPVTYNSENEAPAYARVMYFLSPPCLDLVEPQHSPTKITPIWQL
jgi:hypothetical protein